jgi:hypothetical protein
MKDRFFLTGSGGTSSACGVNFGANHVVATEAATTPRRGALLFRVLPIRVVLCLLKEML